MVLQIVAILALVVIVITDAVVPDFDVPIVVYGIIAGAVYGIRPVSIGPVTFVKKETKK